MLPKKGYSFTKTLQKSVVSILIFGIPVLLELLPTEILNLTLGGALVGLLNYIKYNFLPKEQS